MARFRADASQAEIDTGGGQTLPNRLHTPCSSKGYATAVSAGMRRGRHATLGPAQRLRAVEGGAHRLRRRSSQSPARQPYTPALGRGVFVASSSTHDLQAAPIRLLQRLLGFQPEEPIHDGGVLRGAQEERGGDGAEGEPGWRNVGRWRTP